jgi:hypothetical protein
MLEHRCAECTGEWRLILNGEDRLIACARCGAEYAATPARRRAAVDEILAGAYLRRLTNEGVGSYGDPDLDDVA